MPSPTSTFVRNFEIPVTNGFEPFVEDFVEELQDLHAVYDEPGLAIITDRKGIVQMAGGIFTPEVWEHDVVLFHFLDTFSTSQSHRVENEARALALREESLILTRNRLSRWRNREEGHVVHIALGEPAVKGLLDTQHEAHPAIITSPVIAKVFEEIPFE